MDIPQRRLVKLPGVKAKTTFGATKIYELIKEGRFPKPIRLGARSVAWLESDVDAWIAQRVAESQNSAG